ncbi:MAG: hypothetical protein Q8K68_13750 [Nitrospirota bacterium]|nr:hypothetical protein [Nitrospirota bacterium]
MGETLSTDMNIKEYVQKRKLEMVKESLNLGKQRDQLLLQVQANQGLLNQINVSIHDLDVELMVLDKLEASATEEVSKC